MAYSAIAVEGGLLPPDLLERIAEGDAEGLRPVDFDLDKGVRLTDEFQSAFSDVGSLWRGFDVRLRSSKDSRTTLTREFWMKPTLERLGYGTLTYQQASLFAGGESFDISHRAGEDELAPPVHIVSLDQPLGTRGERSRRSPHATVQEYLNRSDALWGLVTNGERIRLLRDSSRISHPTYAEFDLRPMIEGNLYSEFTILYRILHRTRLPRDRANPHECLLENWYQRGVDEGNRVRDHLRDGVEAALKVLGTGFLAHPSSEGLRRALADGTLTEVAFYRQLLRLVYRLLFLFTIEERRLVLPYQTEHRERQTIYANYYSVNRLRDRCERPFADDQYADLWPGLCRTFTLFRDDDAARSLGLAALNGELFGPDGCKDLEAAQCMNRALLLSIYHLSTFGDGKVRRRVNYAALDVEELGSVYESLLDYRPHLTHDPWQFDLATGNDRKTTGSYYTPPELVHELVERALVPVMNERIAAAKTADEKAQAVLAMRVCDPASGSGHFLLAAARRMARELARIRTGEAEPSPEEFRVAERDVIRHCIYAVDKNPLAVDLCKVALWLESHDIGKPLSFLDHHIRCGDSLVGVFDLAAMERGIPEGAFKAKQIDDKKVATAFRKRNQIELYQQPFDFNAATISQADDLDIYFSQMDIPDDNISDVFAKEYVFRQHMHAEPTVRNQLLADLWLSPFYWRFIADAPEPPTNASWQLFARDTQLANYIGDVAREHTANASSVSVRYAHSLSRIHRFFHWPLEFPDVFVRGGFDVVLGNPPFGNAIEVDTARSESEANVYGCLYADIANGAYDRSSLFLNLSLLIMRDRGAYGMVCPRATASAKGGLALRQKMNSDAPPQFLWCPDDPNLFGGANVFVCLVAGRTGIHPTAITVSTGGINSTETFRDVECLPNSKEHTWWEVVHSDGSMIVPQTPLKVSDIANMWAGCSTAPAYELSDEIDDSLGGRGLKLITTGAIDRFIARWGSMVIRYLKSDYTYPRWPEDAKSAGVNRARERQNRVKILVAGLSKVIEGVLDINADLAGVVSTHVVVPKVESTDTFYLLCAVLNSSLFSYLYFDKFGAKQMAGGNCTIGKSELLEIPVPYDFPGSPSTPENEYVATEWQARLRSEHLRRVDIWREVSRISERLSSREHTMDWHADDEYLHSLISALYVITPEQHDATYKWWKQRNGDK